MRKVFYFALIGFFLVLMGNALHYQGAGAANHTQNDIQTNWEKFAGLFN